MDDQPQAHSHHGPLHRWIGYVGRKRRQRGRPLKWSEERLERLRIAYADRLRKVIDIAAEFGVSHSQICLYAHIYGWPRRYGRAQRAALALAMRGNKNRAGKSKSADERARIAATMKGNTNCLGRKDSADTKARKAAAIACKRGIEVLPSPAPGIRGYAPDYGRNRIVFFRPAA
jgi:hypothetical protein